MSTSVSQIAPSGDNRWLLENGPKELELLFRAIVFHPSGPILVTDDDRNSHEASTGAARLLGLPRQQIIGRKLDDFVESRLKPQVSELWQTFMDRGEQEGVLRLKDVNGEFREVEYTAKGNVLPVRHVLILQDKPVIAAGGSITPDARRVPPWIGDYAAFLLDPAGKIAAWYGGAERIYGYRRTEVLGQNIAAFFSVEDASLKPDDALTRAAESGHFGEEGWQIQKDGSRFWANTITTALRNESGVLEGFARVVRDFSERHERDEKLRRSRAARPVASASAIAGVVSGEFDLVPEVNDRFLEIVGYTRDDLACGHLRWPDLTPSEYAPLDELAHEECLQFGGCTPFEKELICKDGSRVPVLIATAVLKLSPFRWITFVRDLRENDAPDGIFDTDPQPTSDFAEMVGSSPAMRRMQSLVEVVAPTAATVLILGETGTGKELVARAIHRMSPRRRFPFITLNCAAIPTGLLESELFGYEKGAFTGALSQKIGRFEMAHRGTLFLDEVGDIPLDLQPKLLRALQEKAFERLGGTKTIPIDVRLVAATNRDLTQMMGDKLFRSDLYYRLKVFPVNTPPLRDHSEDIPLLARHFTKKYSEKMGRHVDTIPPGTLRALVAWRWPGNVRELENFIERAVILSTGSALCAPLDEIGHGAPDALSDVTLDQVQREHILHMLRKSGGVVSTAARRLGLHRTTLNTMMRRLEISRKDGGHGSQQRSG